MIILESANFGFILFTAFSQSKDDWSFSVVPQVGATHA